MKAYVITSGAIFALITIAHIAHIAMETHVLREPFFLVLRSSPPPSQSGPSSCCGASARVDHGFTLRL